jgi:hypothetical protein
MIIVSINGVEYQVNIAPTVNISVANTKYPRVVRGDFFVNALAVNSDDTFEASIVSGQTYVIPDIQYQVGVNPIVGIPYTSNLIVIPDDCQTLTELYTDADNSTRIDLLDGLSDSDRFSVVTGSGALLNTYDYTKLFSGQVTSYQTGDDKHQWDNIYAPEIATWPTNRPWVFPIIDPTNFNLLLTNNIFGSKQRFTDDLGTAIYASGVLIDHAIGVMVDLTFKAASNWTNAISGAVASTFYGKTDWRIGNVNFWALFTKRAQNGNYIAGLPPVTFLSVPPNSSDRFLWASTSGDGSLTTLANQYILRQGTETLVRNVTGSAAKSSTTPQSIYIRKCFTYNSGIGLMELS